MIAKYASITLKSYRPVSFASFGQRLVELVAIHNGANVLDVATGAGAVLLSAAELVGPQGHSVGIDISKGMVERAAEEIRRLGIRNAETRQMDAEHLEFANEFFDFVLCGFSVFFFPNPVNALLEFHRVLKPEGRVAISTCGPGDAQWNWFSDLKKLHWPSGTPELKSSMSQFSKPEQLKVLFSQAGFASIRVMSEVVELVFASEEEWWSYLQSSGQRGALDIIEKMEGPDGLTGLKAEAFRRIQALRQTDGFHQTRMLLYTVAERPF